MLLTDSSCCNCVERTSRQISPLQQGIEVDSRNRGDYLFARGLHAGKNGGSREGQASKRRPKVLFAKRSVREEKLSLQQWLSSAGLIPGGKHLCLLYR